MMTKINLKILIMMGPNDKLKMAHFKLPHKPIGLEQEICMDTFVIIAFLFITRLKF